MADLAWFEGLSEDQQALVEEVAAETVALQRELTAAANASTLEELRKAGLTVNELPSEDKQRLGETMNAAIETDIREKVGDAFYDVFMTAIAR
jgi:TRAP-type C4-dicarboxylate transport system substrate-binding protein